MILPRPVLFATLAATLTASLPAAAEVVFEEDFRGTGEQNQPEGFRKVGGFNQNMVDLNSDHGVPIGYLDANGAGFPTESSVIVETGVQVEAGDAYRFSLEAHKTGTRSPDYEGDFLYEAYLGDPEDGGTMLASGRAPAAEDGELALDFRASRAGDLFLRLHAGVPSSTTEYSQVEYGAVRVERVDAPAEPG